MDKDWVRDVDQDLTNIIVAINRGPRFIRVTTAQRDLLTTLYQGLIVFNMTTLKLNFYDGTTWRVITST